MLFCSLRSLPKPGSRINKKEVVDAVTILETPPVVVFGIVGYFDTPRGPGQFKRTFDSLKSLFSQFVSSVFSLNHENIALLQPPVPARARIEDQQEGGRRHDDGSCRGCSDQVDLQGRRPAARADVHRRRSQAGLSSFSSSFLLFDSCRLFSFHYFQVRDAFALAKERAPAIIFIDELDTIG